MKHLLSALLIGALMVSCTNEQECEQPQLTNVMFGYQFRAQGNPMTRAEYTHQDILNAINYLAPTQTDIAGIEFAIEDMANRTRQTYKFGKNYTMKCGMYRADYEYLRMGGYAKDGYRVMPYSSFWIKDTIAVNAEQSQYPLTADYSCFALVYDKSTTCVKIDGLDVQNEILNEAGFGVNVWFIRPTAEDWRMELDIMPVNGYAGSEQVITITADDVQLGCYYLLAPVKDFQLAGFSLTLPEFQRGQLGR